MLPPRRSSRLSPQVLTKYKMRDRDDLFLGMILGAGVIILLELMILIFYGIIMAIISFFQ